MASVIINIPADQAVADNSPPPPTPPPIAVGLPVGDTKSSSASHVLPTREIVSIDVFRGFATVILILVVDAGGAFPSIMASPWTGLTLGDLVLPFFLFACGFSVALLFKKVPDRKAATKKALKRALFLFLMGLLVQDMKIGDDKRGRRGWRQAVVWLDNDGTVDSASSFAKRYYPEWLVGMALCSIYMGLTYGLYVPDWKFHDTDSQTVSSVSCGVRGSLSPSCNAAGLIDRFFLGEKHLTQRPSYRRTKECSVSWPALGPSPLDAPTWCHSPFDPEGLLSSLTATVACFIGLNFGHVYTSSKAQGKTIITWIITSLVLVLTGLVMRTIGLPFNRSLYTVSFLCISSGICGNALAALYYMVDVKKILKPALPMKWMGKNVLIVYALSACQVCSIVIQGFYWRSPENNPVDRLEAWMQALFHSKQGGTLVFVMIEILFWCLFSGFIHWKRIYI